MKRPKSARKATIPSKSPKKVKAAVKKVLGNQPAQAAAVATQKPSSGKPVVGKPFTLKIQPGKKLVLHVGCGHKDLGAGLHKHFQTPEWQEVRLDILEELEPDIVADMTNMPHVPSNMFDAVWSSHNIEHVFAHEVMPMFKEFHRVLKNDGLIFLATPDIARVAEDLLKKGLEGTLYKSPSGPITALDILYGHIDSIRHGHVTMAHKTAFTAQTLSRKLLDTKFCNVLIKRDGYNLWARGYKRAEVTKDNNKSRIEQPDVNEMMRKRDYMDQPLKNEKELQEAIHKVL